MFSTSLPSLLLFEKGVQQVFHWGFVHLGAPPLSLKRKQGNGSSRVGPLGRGALSFDVEWRGFSTCHFCLRDCTEFPRVKQ